MTEERILPYVAAALLLVTLAVIALIYWYRAAGRTRASTGTPTLQPLKRKEKRR